MIVVSECFAMGRMPWEEVKISSAPQNDTLHLLDVQLPKYEVIAESNPP